MLENNSPVSLGWLTRLKNKSSVRPRLENKTPVRPRLENKNPVSPMVEEDRKLFLIKQKSSSFENVIHQPVVNFGK